MTQGDYLREVAAIADEHDLLLHDLDVVSVTFLRTIKRSSPLTYYHPLVTIRMDGGVGLAVVLRAVAKALAEVSEP